MSDDITPRERPYTFLGYQDFVSTSGNDAPISFQPSSVSENKLQNWEAHLK